MLRAPAEARGGHSPGHEDARARKPGEDARDQGGHRDGVVPAARTHSLYETWRQQPRHAGERFSEDKGGGRPDPTPPVLPISCPPLGACHYLHFPRAPLSTPDGSNFPLHQPLPTSLQGSGASLSRGLQPSHPQALGNLGASPGLKRAPSAL